MTNRKFHTTFDGEYTCTYDWPEDCMVQGGGGGVVFVRGGDNYTTAFFEAFPRDHNTFIRGEGKTIADAEKAAWDKYQRQSQCDHPSFTRKKYTNGAAFCTECNMFSSNHFEPTTKCTTCGAPTNYTVNTETNEWYCEEHKADNKHPSILCRMCEEIDEAEEEKKDGK